MKGADATKIPMLFVARKFLHGAADENQVRAAADTHFRQAARKPQGAKSRKG